jgi:hypothetical protein
MAMDKRDIENNMAWACVDFDFYLRAHLEL